MGLEALPQAFPQALPQAFPAFPQALPQAFPQGEHGQGVREQKWLRVTASGAASPRAPHPHTPPRHLRWLTHQLQLDRAFGSSFRNVYGSARPSPPPGGATKGGYPDRRDPVSLRSVEATRTVAFDSTPGSKVPHWWCPAAGGGSFLSPGKKKLTRWSSDVSFF